MSSNAGSGEKSRSRWFRAASGRDGRLQTLVSLKKECLRVERTLKSVPNTPNWEKIGPTNVAGRASCLLVHPRKKKRIWLGSAGGGVWRSNDAGQTWTKVWQDSYPQNIGTLAMDPSDSKVLFCGTGEANLLFDNYGGDGLYRSGNGGNNWRRIAGLKQGLPHRIGTIAIDPQDSSHLFVGGIADPFTEDTKAGAGGLYESMDGGASWKHLSFATRGSVSCHQVFFHPRGVFAAFSGLFPQDPLWFWEGNTWKPVKIDIDEPFPTFSGRLSLAYCQSKPKIMYLLATDDNHREGGGGVAQIYKSHDGGKLWNAIPEHSGHYQYLRRSEEYETQMSYNNTIAIDPQNPDRVIWGGVDLHMSTDGGLSWELFSLWDLPTDDPFYAHADHHDLHIVSLPGRGAFRVYDANDGGLNVHENGEWHHRVSGLQTSMFYDLDVSQEDVHYWVGGTQDNGTLLNTTGAPDLFGTLNYGDGGWAVFAPGNKSRIYSTTQNFQVMQHQLLDPFPTSGGNLNLDPPEFLFPNLDPQEMDDFWMVFLTATSNPDQVVTGSYRPWTFSPANNVPYESFSVLDGSEITAIHLHRANPALKYYGTQTGAIFLLESGQISRLETSSLPPAPVCRLSSDPRNADHLICVFGGYGGHSHVFETQNRGQTWQDLDGNNLPDVPHRAVVIPKSHPDIILIANDVGIYARITPGGPWQVLTQNLPFVVIRDLVFHETEGVLFAATYGSGLWRMDLKVFLGTLSNKP